MSLFIKKIFQMKHVLALALFCFFFCSFVYSKVYSAYSRSIKYTFSIKIQISYEINNNKKNCYIIYFIFLQVLDYLLKDVLVTLFFFLHFFRRI